MRTLTRVGAFVIANLSYVTQAIALSPCEKEAQSLAAASAHISYSEARGFEPVTRIAQLRNSRGDYTYVIDMQKNGEILKGEPGGSSAFEVRINALPKDGGITCWVDRVMATDEP